MINIYKSSTQKLSEIKTSIVSKYLAKKNTLNLKLKNYKDDIISKLKSIASKKEKNNYFDSKDRNIINRIKSSIKEYKAFMIKSLNNYNIKPRNKPKQKSKISFRKDNRGKKYIKYILGNINHYRRSFVNKANLFTRANFNKKIASSKNESSEKFTGIYYGEHELFIIPIEYSESITKFLKIIKIDIPTEVIGDSKVENINELSNIIDNVITVLNLEDSALIVLLPSSNFTARSFKEDEIGIFAETSTSVLSKSPFLPNNTIMSYYKALGKNFNAFYRVIYAEKEAITSWEKVLEDVNLPVATFSSSAFNIIKTLSEDIKEEMVIVTDIEKTTTTIYLQIRKCELFSTRLPFGGALYTSNDNSLSDMYFLRLANSIKQILENNSYRSDYKTFVYGTGLDSMNIAKNTLPEGFSRIPDYLFKKNMLDDELDRALANKYQSLLSIFGNYVEELLK